MLVIFISQVGTIIREEYVSKQEWGTYAGVLQRGLFPTHSTLRPRITLRMWDSRVNVHSSVGFEFENMCCVFPNLVLYWLRLSVHNQLVHCAVRGDVLKLNF